MLQYIAVSSMPT